MGAVTSSMAAQFAFFPPSPASYEVVPGESQSPRMTGVEERETVEVVRLETKRRTRIVGVYLRNPAVKLTVLYSHGNAADLGRMYELFAGLSLHLRVSLFGCLEQKYGVKEENVILYGQSVGSGPTLDLAARLPRLKAVILHNPIASGLRVMYPVKRTYRFNMYKNVDKMPLVKCPVLVIHGTDDDVVDWSHGKMIWELCKEKYEPPWAKGGSHCDLEAYPQYIKHLKKFISAVEKSSHPRIESRNSTDQMQNPRSSTDFRETARESNGLRDRSRPTAERRDKPRHSTDCREKSSNNTNMKDQSRSLMDCPEKETNCVGQPEKARNSIDRFGEMIRSVGLCNIDCFRPTTTTL